MSLEIKSKKIDLFIENWGLGAKFVAYCDDNEIANGYSWGEFCDSMNYALTEYENYYSENWGDEG